MSLPLGERRISEGYSILIIVSLRVWKPATPKLRNCNSFESTGNNGTVYI